MDPLVVTVIGIVSPYLAKGAEEFAKLAGETAFKGTKALVTRLSTWWAAEPVAAAAVQHYAADPKRYGKVLAAQLGHDLERDPSFAEELRQLVNGLGPRVDVIQQMEVAENVTGADVRDLVSGSLRIEQHIDNARNVTGLKADRIG